ncbi:hypothetical protein NDU88_000764 [Pleurodeles waltl]|uniref:Uncharacterized protein n=1 Tax=Pleurodeles waltl TaxID=8319 RepID=A0AAV7TGR0_PLEWA|nr:hypothetical protein NDU88_000764 [Pleurodeles waltl]
MGKADRVQIKLQFEQKKTPKARGEGPTVPDPMPEGGGVETEADIKQILMSMQYSLMKIDGQINALTYPMDSMSDWIDKHEEHLDQVERRVS